MDNQYYIDKIVKNCYKIKKDIYLRIRIFFD